jgi:hypothetical protein
MRSSMLNGCGPTTLREIIKENHYLNYDTRVIYYSIEDEFTQKRKILKLAPLDWKFKNLVILIDKTKYNEKILSVTYLTEQFMLAPLL